MRGRSGWPIPHGIDLVVISIERLTLLDRSSKMALNGIAPRHRVSAGESLNGFDVDQLAKLKHSVGTIDRRVKVRARETDSGGEKVSFFAVVDN
jgi:hypothetical protein